MGTLDPGGAVGTFITERPRTDPYGRYSRWLRLFNSWPPIPADPIPESQQRPLVARHRVMSGVPVEHSSNPLPHFVHRIVHAR